MKVFFDTSALVKRYIEEPGSIQVVETCLHADVLMVSIVSFPEMVSTLRRLVREGFLSPSDYQKVKKTVLADLEDAEISNLTPEVIGLAIHCLENHPLRSMDAVHLGCALAMKPDFFVSSDRAQAAAARKEGLQVKEI
jgi:hypothetical protein